MHDVAVLENTVAAKALRGPDAGPVTSWDLLGLNDNAAGPAQNEA
jgi:hypothetical protein